MCQDVQTGQVYLEASDVTISLAGTWRAMVDGIAGDIRIPAAEDKWR